MSIRNLPLGEVRALPVYKADNLTTICEPLNRNRGSLDVSESYRPAHYRDNFTYLLLPTLSLRKYT
jgi:hypothetical protein